MKNEPEPETRSITLAFPSGARFPLVFPFNLCGVEKLDPWILLHLGLQTSAGVFDTIPVCVDAYAIRPQVQAWTEYLIKIGGSLDDQQEATFRCAPRAPGMPLLFVTSMLWSRNGDLGEIRCFYSSLGEINDALKDEAEVNAHPLALLRSSREDQGILLAQIIRALT